MAKLEVLRLGSEGPAVEQWQYFLLGKKLYADKVDGVFGDNTYNATVAFQKLNGLEPEGVVGNKTYGAAMLQGFGVAVDPLPGKEGINWPPKPDFNPLNDAQKKQLFGAFDYVHSPLPGNPENIIIKGNWVANHIVNASIPQMSVFGKKSIEFHRDAVPQLQKLWSDWDDQGLLHLLLTWGGSFVPRLIRGGSSLSQHAYATAFDINVAWNLRGTVPALVGSKGSVRELVEIANANGFFWGGHFKKLDGMHFEIAEIIK